MNVGKVSSLRERTMNIWVDTVQAHDSTGKVIAYLPEVHWTIDERDTISPNAMNEICARVQHELETGLKSARIEQ